MILDLNETGKWHSHGGADRRSTTARLKAAACARSSTDVAQHHGRVDIHPRDSDGSMFVRRLRMTTLTTHQPITGFAVALVTIPTHVAGTAGVAGIAERHPHRVTQGLQTFFEVGAALVTIRNQRLYRAEYATFEVYCRERWEMGRNYMNKIVAAHEVVAHLGTIVPRNQLPANESQVRPLVKLDPAQQRTTWEQVLASAPAGRITAAYVEQVAKQVLSQSTPDTDAVDITDPPIALTGDAEDTHTTPPVPTDLPSLITQAQAIITEYRQVMRRIRSDRRGERDVAALELVEALERLTQLLAQTQQQNQRP